LFFKEDPYTDMGMERFQNIFDLDGDDGLIDMVSNSVQYYYNMSASNEYEDMLDHYTPMNIHDPNCFTDDSISPEETICPVKVEASYINSKQPYNLTYLLTNESMWFFDSDRVKELKDFMHSVTTFSLTY